MSLPGLAQKEKAPASNGASPYAGYQSAPHAQFLGIRAGTVGAPQDNRQSGKEFPTQRKRPPTEAEAGNTRS
jgi:hypothetical protein